MFSALVVGVLPGLLLLGLFYWLDRYEPEPAGHVALAALLGVLVVPLAFVSSRWLKGILGPDRLALMGLWGDILETFLVVAAVEESSKWLLMTAWVVRWREFDEPYDGILYGAALALGFATVENVLYLWQDAGPGLWRLAFLRGILSVPAHALYGASMGGLLGRAKFLDRRLASVGLVAAALGIPWILHGSFDMLCLFLQAWWGWWALAGLSLLMWGLVAGFVYAAWGRSPFRTDRDSSTK